MSDQRKYREAFAKLVANDLLQQESNSLQSTHSSSSTCLPVLSNHHLGASGGPNSTAFGQKLHLKSLVTINDTATWMHCTEVQTPSRPPLPYLLASQPTNYRSTKSTMARQVSNVVKRHSIDTRQLYSASDKVI